MAVMTAPCICSRSWLWSSPSVILFILVQAAPRGLLMATAPQHLPSLASLNRDVANWVDEVARLTTPDRIYWCDGSESEYHMLQRELVAKNELLPLNQSQFPGCHLYRSAPSDVARVEHLTFV